MSPVNSILATIEFEVARVLTARRLVVALVMALFPPLMILILTENEILAFDGHLVHAATHRRICDCSAVVQVEFPGMPGAS